MFKIFSQGIQAPDGSEFGLPDVEASPDTIESLLTVVFGAAAAVAILIIVVASLNIATGGGDPDKISKGKKTIVFALIGLAIALTGEFIVLTILNRI